MVLNESYFATWFIIHQYTENLQKTLPGRGELPPVLSSSSILHHIQKKTGMATEGRFFLTKVPSPHFEEDLSVLSPDFEQRMQMAAGWRHSKGTQVVGLEAFLFPGAPAESEKESHQQLQFRHQRHLCKYQSSRHLF